MELILYVFVFGLAVVDVRGVITCLDGWTTFGDSCYFFGFDHAALSFIEAQHFCNQRGGYLVEINDVHEDHFILSFVKHILPRAWWIGLSDQDIEGEFRWDHSRTSPSYTRWGPHQPDATAARDEDCVALSHHVDFTWQDANCASHYYPICEASEEFGQVIG